MRGVFYSKMTTTTTTTATNPNSNSRIETINVGNDITISWLTVQSLSLEAQYKIAPPRPVELSEQIRRRKNMSMGIEFRCLYCDNFVVSYEDPPDYPKHVFTMHKNYLPYPTIEWDLNTPKAGKKIICKTIKSYNEYRKTEESKIFRVVMKKEKQKWWQNQLPIQQRHQQSLIKNVVAGSILANINNVYHYYHHH